MWWTKPRNVSVVTDTPGWFDLFALALVDKARARGDNSEFFRNADQVMEGGVAFFLSCQRIVPPETLARNRHNIVVHASALPQGRGWSPMVYQILEGKNRIPISMIFADKEVDSGDIVMTDELVLNGHELNRETRSLLGAKIVEMCLAYLALPEPPVGKPQEGEPTRYHKRTAADSELDPDKSIREQFNLLRVVDNERYPAFFIHGGNKYVLRIEQAESGLDRGGGWRSKYESPAESLETRPPTTDNEIAV